jgi:predicted AlkP superfamily pyrophosphatase or phosphodiesterase
MVRFALRCCIPPWVGIVAVLLVGTAASAGAPTVILISLDGAEPRAARTPSLETLAELARRGVVAERLTPVFPTNTFPNHVTLVTGVAPERHGIVNNVFLDPERGVFRRSDDPTWIEAEPLWSIAARHGIVSASYYWVGSQGPWRSGHGPRYWKRFDASTPDREKVEQILAWLDLEPGPERPQLVTAWFPGADSTGHRFGPDAPEVQRALERQDAALGRLVSGLDARRAFEDTTLLVVSDHGMLEVERRVDLDAALDAARLPATVWGGGGFASVTVEGEEAVSDRVVEVARGLGLEAYRRTRAPAALRTGNPRFGAVVVLAPPGVAMVRTRGVRNRLRDLFQDPLRGSHGYRPDEPRMGALFVAAGRGMPAGTKLGEVDALDVAPTVLALLGVPIPVWMEGRPLEAFQGAGSSAAAEGGIR